MIRSVSSLAPLVCSVAGEAGKADIQSSESSQQRSACTSSLRSTEVILEMQRYLFTPSQHRHGPFTSTSITTTLLTSAVNIVDRRFRQRHWSPREPIQCRPDHAIRDLCHVRSFRRLSHSPLRSSKSHADIHALLGYPCNAECCGEELCGCLCCEILSGDV